MMNIKALACFFLIIISLISATSFGQLGDDAVKSTKPKFSHQYSFFESDYYYFIDTSFNSLNWYHQFNHRSKDNFSYNVLGSMGNPMNALTLPSQKDIWDYNGLGAYTPYFKSLDNIPFYQTKSPITEANYWMGYDRGQSFNISHTQNITDDWNFVINYKRLNDLGYYDHNRNIQSTFLFNTNYIGKESGYNAHFYYLNEKFNTEENGGVVSDSLFELNQDQRVILDVNLDQDTRELRNREFFVDQNLDLNKIFGLINSRQDTALPAVVDSIAEVEPKEKAVIAIGHTFRYNASYNKYVGHAPEEGSVGYYDNYFNVTLGEYIDSSHYRSYENAVYLKGQVGNKTRLNVKGGIKNIITEYEGYNYRLVNSGWGITGNIAGKVSEIVSVRGDVDYIFTGNLQQSLDIKAQANLKPVEWLRAFGGYQYSLRYPDYFEQFYFSNNYIWQNRLKKQGVNRLWYGLGWGRNNSLEITNAVYSNYTYYDADVNPVQSGEAITALKAELNQNFEFWNFVHLDNRVAFQKVGGNSKAMPLPEWKTRNALYFEFFLFKKALKCLAGAELNYFTEYYSQSYNPATGRFYNAREELIGNFPIVDLFATFQLRTARIFFKYEHINQPGSGGAYYAAPHFPFPDRKFRIGITWRFFN
ncbi:putative porin [Owenweeksia hongkongensis]|uniref:putative porin n=1 Tax=Owenweeksia hongkongensis TaxID=253245 RepID=UPI003A924BD1